VPNPLSSNAQKVQQALLAQGLPCQVVELPDSTRSAEEAARAIGAAQARTVCVGQIAKSLIFAGTRSQQPVLIIASGANRVNEQKVAELLGESIAKADATFVRQQTGFPIGGVPPLGHPQPLRTLIDEDLLQYDEIWAAAGTPHAVFRLIPQDLTRVTGGTVTSIK
jgi:prolyl-tRNA editing enzyme YbaK/EbsC (Cys-tRNA(Pro) deacylase)